MYGRAGEHMGGKESLWEGMKALGGQESVWEGRKGQYNVWNEGVLKILWKRISE